MPTTLERKKAKRLIILAQKEAKKLPIRARKEAFNVQDLATHVAQVLLKHTDEHKDVEREELGQMLGEVVDTKINGKLIGIKNDLIEVKNHLGKQDEAIKDLGTKIMPLDTTAKWFYILGKGIIYSGGICLALIAIYNLFLIFNIKI